MLINQDRFDNVFDEVKDLTCRGDVAVFVFVSMDCDGLCATHILKALFDYEHIRYSIHAISGYTDLKENFSEMIGEQDGPCAAFLINCGANTNVQEYLELDKYPGLVLTIVDSHRPMDLANIQDPDEDCQHKVYVIDSGDPDEDKPPDFSILDEMDSESEKSGSDS
jgi:cell division control protein 45